MSDLSTKPKPPKTDKLPPYKVLLHNDTVNEFLDVIKKIMSLTSLNKEEAAEKVTEAHKEGVALLLVTHKERAELYVDQFQSLVPPINVTTEADQ